MVLLRFILILILVYFIISFLGRLLFSSAARKMQGNQDFRKQQNEDRRKEGEVTVESGQKSSRKRFDKGEGEYVKYEEIKEDRSD